MSEHHGASSFDRDRTDLRFEDLAQRVRELEAEVARAQRLATMGTLACTIAHEFNNLLTPMLSYAQMALSHPEDSELVAKSLAKTIDTSERAGKIASALLGFARDDTEDTEQADIRACVDQALACLAREPAKDGIDVRVEVPADLHAGIPESDLQQILLNLFLNACQAMRPYPGVLEITAERSTGNADQREITIRDTGCGMPAELLGHIFNPFVSGSRPTPEHRGTGLGLTICRRLTEAAGGTITVESKPGEGTVFRLTLPASASNNARSAA